jgi:hypothetical protein
MSVEQQQNEIAEIINKVPTEGARNRLTAELNILVSRYEAPAATAEEKSEVVARLSQLRMDAEITAQVSLWSRFSMGLVIAILILFFGGIFLYLNGMRPGPYWTVEATRPIIVYTLIVAMLGFGGLLIVRPLFSAEDPKTLQERFRLAREVFMVFAGVFGTIIGFYFGTGGPTPADPPSLGTPAFVDGKVTVEVRGGRRPLFADIILPPANRQRMSVASDTLSYTIAACPAGARIEVTDSDHRIADALLSCPPGGSAGTAAPTTTNTNDGNGTEGNGI